MIAAVGWGIACVQLIIIIVLFQALDKAQKERDDVMKWAAKREILRKFHEDNQ